MRTRRLIALAPRTLTTLTALAACSSLLGGCAAATGRGAEIVACAPGVSLQIACGVGGVGVCSGDPILSVCDGATTPPDSCGGTGFSVLRRDDDSEGRCPSVIVDCPDSGSLAVRPTSFAGRESVCRWEVVVLPMSQDGI